MIAPMSPALRIVLACVLVASACGGPNKQADEPQTAREKQLQEARASGEDDQAANKNWGKWRYSGDRGECFFQVKGRCFKTENKACQAARCKKPQQCVTTGAGPATVSCK
jgi:hypothetical protein